MACTLYSMYNLYIAVVSSLQHHPPPSLYQEACRHVVPATVCVSCSFSLSPRGPSSVSALQLSPSPRGPRSVSALQLSPVATWSQLCVCFSRLSLRGPSYVLILALACRHVVPDMCQLQLQLVATWHSGTMYSYFEELGLQRRYCLFSFNEKVLKKDFRL